MREAAIQAAVQRRLRERGCVVLKVHGGLYQPAALDLIGSRPPDGRAFAIEVKVPGERMTPRQAAIAAQWGKAGAIVGVATSAAEAEQLVFGDD